MSRDSTDKLGPPVSRGAAAFELVTASQELNSYMSGAVARLCRHLSHAPYFYPMATCVARVTHVVPKSCLKCPHC